MTTKHPLATLQGLVAFAHMVDAYQVWQRMTKVQRALLCELCPPVFAESVETGVLPDPLPSLPDSARSSTRGSMVNAGLVDNAGRLTLKAVRAWYWKIQYGSGGES